MNENEQAVLVTTEFGGVFFGYTSDTSGNVISLRNARNCIYWPVETGGFGGLASDGPVDGSRIGAVIPMINLRKITSVSVVSDAAQKKWESADVYRG